MKRAGVIAPTPPAVDVKKEVEMESSKIVPRESSPISLVAQALPTREPTSAAAIPTKHQSSPTADPSSSLPAPVDASFGSLPPPAAQLQPKVSYEPIVGSSGETVDDVSILARSQCTGQPKSHQPQQHHTQRADMMDEEEEGVDWSSSIEKQKSTGEREDQVDSDAVESQGRRPRTRSRSAFSVGQYRPQEQEEVSSKRPKIEVVSSPVAHRSQSPSFPSVQVFD